MNRSRQNHLQWLGKGTSEEPLAEIAESSRDLARRRLADGPEGLLRRCGGASECETIENS